MTETTTTTAVTPIIMPSSVSTERSLCAQMAESASFNVSISFTTVSTTFECRLWLQNGGKYWMREAGDKFTKTVELACYSTSLGRLFPAQGFDGVKARSFPGGPETENDSDRRRD